MIDELMLLSGVDIPFTGGQSQIHVPTLEEIGMMTEEQFYMACEILTLTKETLNLPLDTLKELEPYSNFDIILSLLKEQGQDCVINLLTLIFPFVETIKFLQQGICILTKNKQTVIISNGNYDEFKDILIKIFCLNTKDDKEFKPKGDKAREIAEKIKRGRRNKTKSNKPTKVAILSRYASILAVGTQKSLTDIMNYTVYQLFDEFKRFEAKQAYDWYITAKMQGAKDLEEVESWMRDLYEEQDSLHKELNNGNLTI